MLKRLAFIAMLGILAAVGVLAAQSVPLGTPKQGIPKSNSGKSGQDNAASARDEQRPTQTVVNVVQAEPPISKSPSEESAENLKVQRDLAIFTGLLVVVGFLQVITMALQTGLLRGTLRAVQRQGDIAERAERAWVTAAIGEMPPIVPQENTVDIVNILYVSPAIKNHGRTISRIIKMKLNQMEVANPSDLPSEPSYEGTSVRTLEEELVLPPQASAAPLSIGITIFDLGKIIRDNRFLYIYGFTEYFDAYEKPHVTRFCFVYHVQKGFNPHADGFYPVCPSRAYSYAD